jgi:hypothetical protein
VWGAIQRGDGSGARAAALILGCLSASALGCHEVRAVAPLGEASAALLFGITDDVAVEASAIEHDGASWGAVGLAVTDSVQAATYGCGLARLGLRAGRTPLTNLGEGTPRVPTPLARLRLDGDAWTPIDGPEPALDAAFAQLPLDDEARCAASGSRYTARDLPVPADLASPAFILRLDARRVLVGDVERSLLVVERGGRVSSIGAGAPTPVPLANHRFRGATAAPSGGYWLVDDAGALWAWSGDIMADARLVSENTPLQTVERAALAASGPGEPVELFVVSSSLSRGLGRRVFARFDGGAWSVLDEAWHRDPYLPDVARAGPGRALAIGTNTTNSAAVSIFDAGAVRGQVLPNPAFESARAVPTAVLWHSRLGYVVAADDGSVLVESDGRWLLVPPAVPTYYTRILFETEAGFVASGGRGRNFDASVFDEYVIPDGLCGAARVFTRFKATHHASFGDGVEVVLDTSDWSAPFNVTLLERGQRPAACSTL